MRQIMHLEQLYSFDSCKNQKSAHSKDTAVASVNLSTAGGPGHAAAAMPRAGLPPSGTPRLQPAGDVKSLLTVLTLFNKYCS